MSEFILWRMGLRSVRMNFRAVSSYKIQHSSTRRTVELYGDLNNNLHELQDKVLTVSDVQEMARVTDTSSCLGMQCLKVLQPINIIQ